MRLEGYGPGLTAKGGGDWDESREASLALAQVPVLGGTDGCGSKSKADQGEVT